jgi:hypothetical protein
MKHHPNPDAARTRKSQLSKREGLAAHARHLRGSRIGQEQLERLAPLIQEELRKLALLGALSPAAALHHIQVAIFGEHGCGHEERKLFLRVAAPLARRVAIEIAPVGERFEACDISVVDLGAWLTWLDETDATTARIVDLYCFVGASVKETAAIVGLDTGEVAVVLRSTLKTLRSHVRLPAVAVSEEISKSTKSHLS